MASVTHWSKVPERSLDFALDSVLHQNSHTITTCLFSIKLLRSFSGVNTVRFWRFWEILCTSKGNQKGYETAQQNKTHSLHYHLVILCTNCKLQSQQLPPNASLVHEKSS